MSPKVENAEPFLMDISIQNFKPVKPVTYLSNKLETAAAEPLGFKQTETKTIGWN